MNFLKSTFGAYAEAANLQALIDASNARFNVPFWNRFFSLGIQSLSLTYVTVIGKTRIDSAASVVSRDSRTPMRSRPNLGKLTGELPAIKVMKVLAEDDYRTFLSFQALQISDAQKKNQLLTMLFGDVESTVNSINKRLDYMCLEGISTGFITIDETTNPDGVDYGVVDLLMPVDNYLKVSKDWSDPTATPMADIALAMEYIEGQNKSIEKILISRAMSLKLLKNAEVASVLKGFNNPGSNAKFVATLDRVNEYLSANEMPNFEVIREKIVIEIDGKPVTKTPFETKNLVFVPAGNLGEIKHAIAIEQLSPTNFVNYAQRGPILVSKWFSNEPFGEYTKAEWNAFPSFDQIENTFILETDQVGEIVIPADQV